MSAWKPTVSGQADLLEQLQHVFPTVHAAPADLALGGEPLAVVLRRPWPLPGRSRRSSWCCPCGSFAQSATPQAESMRTTPCGRMPSSRSFAAIRQALRTWPTNFARSSALPMAEPPPVGGHTGATSEPTTKPFARILSASALMSSSLLSMETCGSNRNRSTPSNLTPLTSARAVRSSIVSRSMQGSAPGLPLPTSPGHMAL